jgi:hypothetical protein
MPTQVYKNKEGKRVSGVTTILNNLGWKTRPLMLWAIKEVREGRDPLDYTQKAADAGAVGHHLCDCHINKRDPNLSTYSKDAIERGTKAFNSYLDWERHTKLEIIESEMPLVSNVYNFGGTPDALGRIDGKYVLLDWKTGNGTYEDMLCQIAAYGVLIEENKGIEIEGYHLLRIGKEFGDFHHHYWPELIIAWDTFEYCLKIHELHKTLKKML